MSDQDLLVWCPICGSACVPGERCPHEHEHRRLQRRPDFEVVMIGRDVRTIGEHYRVVDAEEPEPEKAKPWWKRW
jgi:hypothetical protein